MKLHQKRRFHKIPWCQMTRVPKVLIVLTCTHTETPSPLDPDEAVLSLRECMATVITHRPGKAVSVKSFHSTKPQEVWKWIMTHGSSKGQTWLYCYNAAFTLPLTGLWDIVKSGYASIQFAIMRDPPTIIRLWRAGSTVRVLDVLNYCNLSLEEIARSMNWPIGLEPRQADPQETWSLWLEDKHQSVKEWVTQLVAGWSKKGLGKLGMTSASCAFNNWRHGHYQKPIFVHADQQAIDLERDGYRGGLIECYEIGTVRGLVYHLDVNSLYPWAMQCWKLPCKLERYHEDRQWGKCELLGNPDYCIADVDLDSPCDPYPVLHNGLLCYARGRFRTVLVGDELSDAILRRHVVRIYRTASYRMEYLFSGYVEHWYNQRLACRDRGDYAGDLLAKMMLNSLYGKWASGSEVWETDDSISPPQPICEWFQLNGDKKVYDRFRSYGSRVERMMGTLEWVHSFPAIAAWITMIARRRMLALMRTAGEEEVYYCCQDSLFVSRSGYERLHADGQINGRGLGKLKIKEVGHGLIIRNVNSLTFNGRSVESGVKIDHELLANGTYLQESGYGLRSQVRDGGPANLIVGKTSIRKSGTYAKGTLCSDGRVKRFSLP